MHPSRRTALLAAVTSLSLALSACAEISSVRSVNDGVELARRTINIDTLVRVVATPESQAFELTPTPVPPDYSTAALVKLRSKIRVGIRFDAPPLSRVNDQGELEGFDVDLAREFAKRWLGSEKNVEFVQVTSSSAPEKVKAREIDFAMGGLVKTRAAEAEADFSNTYLLDGEALLVRTGTYSDFASLAGQPVVYIDDGATFALRDAQNANGVTITTRGANSYAEAYNALLTRDVEAMAGRWRRLRTRAAQDPGLSVMTVFKQEPIGILLPPNDSEWADLVNITLSNMMLDGAYARIYQQWFGLPPDFSAFPPLQGQVDLQLAQLPDALQTTDRLAQIQQNKKFRVAYVANPPFSRIEENNLPGGFEVELAIVIGQRVTGSADAIEWVPFGASLAETAQNADLIIGGTLRTQSNERQIDFILPTYKTGESTIAMAVPVRQSPLRDAVNLSLQQIVADGTYAEIYGRWFADSQPAQIEQWR
jgi:aspartate/glutamate/glutamine transport system substrate-binding protein